jgi:hypothetical protein
MEPSDYDEIQLCKIMYSVRSTGTTGGIKQMGTNNRLENGRHTWVALCAHPTHT